jgi:LPXTG-site transpeptidase (sortase) family protein
MITLPTLPLEAQTANILELPEFGIKAPIWKIDTPDLKLIYKKLKQGVVLYPGSALPGQGYAIIIGHSSQYPWQSGKYKSVFSLLSELQKGDKIYVYWEQKPLVFEVQEKKIFLPWPKGNEVTETIFPPENEPILILQSCWPVGIDYKRVAVKTILISH